MNMRFFMIILFFTAMASIAHSQVFTDFESDSLDGWRSEGDGMYSLELNTGNPGNCMRVDDDATGDLNIAIAPVKFLGNWSSATISDSVSVDVYVHQISGSILANSWVFRISGPGGSAQGPLVTAEIGQWNHFAIAMDSTQWQITSGNWTAILENVNHFEVRAEYINGNEYILLDNISLSFSPLVVPVAPPLITDFEKGSYEGWIFPNSGGISIPTSGGNPGRYVRISDATGITYGVAPPKYLGDWSQLDQAAAIVFDIQVTNFSGPYFPSDFWVKISGTGGEAIIPMDSAAVVAAFNQWKTFSFLITEDNWQIISGNWESILADVRELRLVLEYINGTEIVWFDNFRISNSRPVAAFSVDPVFTFIGETVHFYDHSLNAPISWLWQFGDGSSSTSANPDHIYEQAGTYEVRLITGNYFGSDTLLKEEYVQIAGITDSMLYADEFDDNDIHPAWQFMNGTWVEQNQTMVQNSNYYQGSYLGGAYALVGSSQWKNYQLNVDIRSSDNDKIGVVFNYQDDLNFYLITWQKEGAHRAIKRFVDGSFIDLAADDAEYEINQWYHLSVSTMNGNIQVFIDSTEIFSVVDSTFLTGKAGLYCHGNQNSYWDNFEVINLDFISSIENSKDVLYPLDFALDQNYPNPFNPVTAIEYRIAESGFVDLSVFNILGQKVATLVSAEQKSGVYKIEWNAEGLAGGVYLYRLTSEKGFTQVRKLVLMK
jgi:PKD repeat protein